MLQGPNVAANFGGPCGGGTRIKSPATGVLYSVPRYDAVSGLGLDSYLEYCIILLDNKEFISNFISRDAPSGGYSTNSSLSEHEGALGAVQNIHLAAGSFHAIDGLCVHGNDLTARPGPNGFSQCYRNSRTDVGSYGRVNCNAEPG